jgi:hypothetical protein
MAMDIEVDTDTIRGKNTMPLLLSRKNTIALFTL